MLKDSSNTITEISSYIGKTYKRTDGDVYITILEEDLAKTKTCLVEFPNGRTMKLSLSTINDTRLWIPYVGDVPEPEPPEPETYVSGTEDEDPTAIKKPARISRRKPGPKPMSPEQRKPKKPRPKKPQAMPEDIVEILKNISVTYNIEMSHNEKLNRRYSYRYKDFAIMDVYCGRQRIVMSVRPVVVEDMTLEDVHYTNHLLGASVRDSYDNDLYTLKILIEQSKRYIDTGLIVKKNRRKKVLDRRAKKKQEKKKED